MMKNYERKRENVNKDDKQEVKQRIQKMWTKSEQEEKQEND